MNRNELLNQLEKKNIKLSVKEDKLIVDAPKGVLTPELRNSLAEHKEDLIRLLRQTEIGNTSVKAIAPDISKKYEPFPLTDIQQAHWIGRNGIFELGNVANHHYLEFETSNLDLSRLSAAWQKLIDRHEIMRAVVLPTGDQKVLEKVPPYEISILDLRGLEKKEIEVRLIAIREKLSHQILPLEQWPWFDIRATYLDEERVRIHLSIDLLMVDAASIRILFDEWNQLYQNPEITLTPLKLSFRDYVINKEALQDSQVLKRSRDYWFSRLDNLPPAPELSIVNFPSELKNYRFKRHSAKLEPNIWHELKQRSQNFGFTPSVILLAAFAEVLTTWSKNPRFTLNLTVLERLPLHPEIHRVVGDFTNTILLVVDNSTKAIFTDRARKIQQQLLQDLDHLHVSGVEVLRELGRRQTNGLTAVMPIVFSSVLGLNSFNKKELEFNFLGEAIYGISQTPQVSLDHQLTEQNGALIFNWDVVEELFPEGLLEDMFSAYCNLLHRLAKSEAAWVESSPQLLPEAQISLRYEINNTSTPVSPQTLHGLFIERVKIQPESVAVIAPECSLTYQELYQRANNLGLQLQQLGATPNTLVGVVMEKGWEQVVAVLGILMSGAAYLPIDPSLPQQRQHYLLEQGEVKLVVTQSRLENDLSWRSLVQCLRVELEAEILPQTPLNSGNNRDLAYVIYTSGSTGLPKGVAIDHRGAVNTILDINHKFKVEASDRVLALSALNFDLSVYDIFGILAAGGTIVIPPLDALKDPASWLDLIVQRGITLWNSVPALMEMLVEYLGVKSPTIISSLRLALLSGDWLPVSLPEKIKTYFPKIEIVSLGGATEASIWSIYYGIKTVNPNWKSIPYGQPLSNQNIYIFNDLMEPTPVWVAGQLYIGGIGLALGYWRDEEKTNASFITLSNGERLYKTGDLGRYLPDGNIEFLGREDFQVKINGYRIELGEIEGTLKQHPNIKNALVTAIGEDRGKKSLIGYVVPETEKVSDGELRRFLQARLPEYAIPWAFIILDSFPLTNNGKIDRRSLPLPDQTRPKLEKTFVPPRNRVEELLASTWTEVFDLKQIGIHDNFFDLGGHSFLALQLITKINQKLDTDISLNILFQYPTIAELADRLGQNTENSATYKHLVPIREGTKNPLFCIHPAGGEVMIYRYLADCLGGDRPILGLQSGVIDNPDREYESIDRMAVEYAQEIRQYQPQSPYYLMGWSMGGVIAVSVAKELEKQGQQVAFVGVVDSYLISENAPTFEGDPFKELALVFGGTFVDAFISFDAQKQQKLRDELANLDSHQRLQRITALLSTDIPIDILEKQLLLTQIHDRLLKIHRSPTIQSPIYSWWASDRFEDILPRTDWSKYTTGARYTKILNSNHFSIIRPPHIETIAREISQIYNDEISTLADLPSVQAGKFPEARALIFEDKALTYLQLDRQSNRLANVLLDLGIKARSRVALLAKDSLNSYEILFACCKVNAVFVPINWRLVADEVSYILRDANVEILFVGTEFNLLVESIKNEIDNVKTIITLEENNVSYREYNDERPNVTVQPNDVAVQMYTSGTTGRPKGVQLANYSFFAIAKEFAKLGKSWINWNSTDKSLITLPSFHIGGLWWAIRGLASGAENVLLATFRDIEVLEVIEKYRITKTCMVPAMIQVLLREPKCKKTDFSSLEYIVYGGSPIAESLLKEAIATFGCNFVQIYGMTETGNCAVSLPAEDHISTNPERLKSAGKPFPGVSVAILDSEGKPLDCHQVGEICIKSPANTIGYWNLPEATAKTLVNGWIHTGDAGYLDEEGYIYICDRLKDMICYAGENVYPAEIENVLYEHPAVAEVAVIGVPDPDFGESIKAIVVLKPGMKATALDIISFVRGKIADFKLPRSVEFAESLPRTPSGKLQKGKLREKYWQGYQRRVN